jgi:hypothetical protein
MSRGPKSKARQERGTGPFGTHLGDTFRALHVDRFAILAQNFNSAASERRAHLPGVLGLSSARTQVLGQAQVQMSGNRAHHVFQGENIVLLCHGAPLPRCLQRFSQAPPQPERTHLSAEVVQLTLPQKWLLQKVTKKDRSKSALSVRPRASEGCTLCAAFWPYRAFLGT